MNESRSSPHALLRSAQGAAVVTLIMLVGSLVLWIGTPLLWLWVGSEIQGATDSLGAALAAMFIGVIVSVALLAALLSSLSRLHRANHIVRGLTDPGDAVLERVLVVTAGFALAAFAIWFLFLAGASPVPLGLQV